MVTISLGPSHPDYGKDLEYGPPSPYQRGKEIRPCAAYTKPAVIRCSACGAEKPAARSLCPCGAFATPAAPSAPRPGPGQQCAPCRTRAKAQRTTAAIQEIREAGNLGRVAAG